MKFYWLGDSWVAGVELELQVDPADVKKYRFPTLVSDHFNAEHVNLGVPGTSNNQLPRMLSDVIDEINPKTDIVFFCLTASHRTSFLGENNIPLHVLPSITKDRLRSNEHPHWKEWYKYFDTPQQRLYNYELIINLLSQWCLNRGIKFYFLNLFTSESKKILDLTTEDQWLLPKNQCIAQYILPIIDNEIGFIVRDDRVGLPMKKWSKQRTALEKYIKPGFCHPNVDGHRKIADEIIKLLEKNNAKN